MAGRFTKNVLISLATQGLIFTFGIGTSVIIARILGPEKKGIYSLVLLLPAFMVYFTNFGVGQATVFYVGKKKYPPKEIFGNNIIYTAIITIFAALIGLIIIFFFSNELLPGVETKYLLLSLFLIPGRLFMGFILPILLGCQKIKRYNFILFFRVFLTFVLVGIFLWMFRLGVKAAMATEFLAIIIVCVVLFFMVKKETNGICLKPNKDYFKDSSLYGIKFYSGSILYFLQSRVAMPLINLYLNPAMVGFYSISVGLSEKVWLISDAVGTVLFPKVSSGKDKKEIKEFTPLIFRSTLIIVILIAIALFVSARWLIILLYSDVFQKSINPFKILLIGAVAISGWKILENDLKGRGKPMLNTYITGVATIVNIILYILWIPKFGILGASLAASISHVIALSITLLVYCKISGNKIKDVIFIKKSDLKVYHSIFITIKERFKYK